MGVSNGLESDGSGNGDGRKLRALEWTVAKRNLAEQRDAGVPV